MFSHHCAKIRGSHILYVADTNYRDTTPQKHTEAIICLLSFRNPQARKQKGSYTIYLLTEVCHNRLSSSTTQLGRAPLEHLHKHRDGIRSDSTRKGRTRGNYIRKLVTWHGVYTWRLDLLSRQPCDKRSGAVWALSDSSRSTRAWSLQRDCRRRVRTLWKQSRTIHRRTSTTNPPEFPNQRHRPTIQIGGE